MPKSKPLKSKSAKSKRPKSARITKAEPQKLAKMTAKIPNVFRLTKATALLIWQNKRLLAGITLVYGLLNLVLVQGLAANSDLSQLKATLDQLFTGNFGSLISGLSVFAVLVTSAGNSSSQTAGAYQFSLAIVGSLAIIWALRQVMAEHQLRIRDAYYRGMYPLVPFILVLLVIGLQLIPLFIGSSLYSLVIANGIAVQAIEKILWAALYALLAFWSFYMVSASIFALYIVTLPDMTPLKALRSARDLVRKRRWQVLRKLLFLPLVLLVVAAVIMLPLIIWLTALAQWVFFILTMSALLATHTYIYNLYRELLNE